MKVKVFRCRICGDPYIGESPPSRCPFCGAEGKYIVDAHKWNPNEFDVELTDVSRKNLEAAFDLEISNTSFYSCALEAAKKAGDEYMTAKFKSLMKVEREHASAICKFLKQSLCDEAPPKGTCSDDARKNSKEGYQREERAIKAYAKFRDEATEPRMKEFFGALVEIETDHLEIHRADTA